MKFKEISNKTAIFLLILITFVSLFFRIYNPYNHSVVFSDTGRDLLVAKKIAQNDAPLNPFLTSSSGLHSTPIYYWIISVFWSFGGSIQNTIFVHAFTIGLLTPIIFFFIGKKMSDNNLGLFLSFYFSIQPYFVSLSRWIWQPNLLILLIPLLFLIFISLFEVIDIKNIKKKVLFLLSFFLIANISFHIHLSSIFIISFLVILLIIKSKKNKQFLIALVSGYLLTLILRVLFLKFENNTMPIFTFNINELSINTYKILTTFDNTIFIDGLVSKPNILSSSFILLFIVFIIIMIKNRNESLTTHLKTLIIGSLLSFIAIFYTKRIHTYFFIPQLIFFQTSLATIIYLLLTQTKRKMGQLIFIILFSSLAIYYMKLNLPNSQSSDEIYIANLISKTIYKDIEKNSINNFSIDFQHGSYGPVDHRSTFNAILWLYLEELTNKELVTISSEYPTIQEPQNTNIQYNVSINTTTENYENKTIIFNEKINYEDQVIIDRELLLQY